MLPKYLQNPTSYVMPPQQQRIVDFILAECGEAGYRCEVTQPRDSGEGATVTITGPAGREVVGVSPYGYAVITGMTPFYDKRQAAFMNKLRRGWKKLEPK